MLAVGTAVALNTYNLSQNGYANAFYAAAVRSMLGSLHNFLFASFDPLGLITVDKPPLALWLQTAAAKLFGFSPLALLLPQALLGAATVLVIYLALRTAFGVGAAVVGAGAVATFPAFVAISRDNLPDPLLLFLLSCAAVCVVAATKRGRIGPLLGAAVLVGLAFNTKTLAAYVPLPAFFLAYLLLAPGSWRLRLLHLGAAAALLGAVSFAWIAAVELTPASHRPYVGGSLENSELGLTFDYNGLGRVAGEEGAPGEIPYRAGASPLRFSQVPAHRNLAIYTPLDHRGYVPIRSEAGPPGLLRLFDGDLGGQDGWLLPAALISLVALAVQAQRQRDRELALFLTVFGGWFLLEAGVLSLARGIVHPYYTSALAPPSGALIGAGVGVSAKGKRTARLAFLAGAAACVATEALLLARAGMSGWVWAAAAGGATALLYLLRGRPPALAPCAVALLLVPAGAYAATTWLAPVQGTFPAAGPHAAAGPGGVGLEGEDRVVIPHLVSFLRPRTAHEEVQLFTVSSVAAAPLILLGLRAASLGGYAGTDPAFSGRSLARLVAAGKANYVLLGGPYSERGGNAATKAVLAACRPLPQAAWGGPPLYPYAYVLYSCAGRATRLRRFRGPAPLRFRPPADSPRPPT